MGRIVPNPDAPDAASQARGHFDGLLDEVKVYYRPLSLREVIAEYNDKPSERAVRPRHVLVRPVSFEVVSLSREEETGRQSRLPRPAARLRKDRDLLSS